MQSCSSSLIIMRALPEHTIKEIADQLDCGFRCFCHRENGELICIPDKLRFAGMDDESWAEEEEKLDNDFGSYVEVERP